MNPVEREKLVQENMKRAEAIAKEMYDKVKDRLCEEKLTIADSLHIGVILSAYLISTASKFGSKNISQEELLEQYTEALSDQILERGYEAVRMN